MKSIQKYTEISIIVANVGWAVALLLLLFGIAVYPLFIVSSILAMVLCALNAAFLIKGRRVRDALSMICMSLIYGLILSCIMGFPKLGGFLIDVLAYAVGAAAVIMRIVEVSRSSGNGGTAGWRQYMNGYMVSMIMLLIFYVAIF